MANLRGPARNMAIGIILIACGDASQPAATPANANQGSASGQGASAAPPAPGPASASPSAASGGKNPFDFGSGNIYAKKPGDTYEQCDELCRKSYVDDGTCKPSTMNTASGPVILERYPGLSCQMKIEMCGPNCMSKPSSFAKTRTAVNAPPGTKEDDCHDICKKAAEDKRASLDGCGSQSHSPDCGLRVFEEGLGCRDRCEKKK